MAKSDLIDEDVIKVYDVTWRQIAEDRRAVVAAYDQLHNLMGDSVEKWAISGDTLAKFADMRVKQTGQLVELLKIIHKNKQDDENLTEADVEKIRNSI